MVYMYVVAMDEQVFRKCSSLDQLPSDTPTNLTGHLSLSPPFILIESLLFSRILLVTDRHMRVHVIQMFCT